MKHTASALASTSAMTRINVSFHPAEKDHSLTQPQSNSFAVDQSATHGVHPLVNRRRGRPAELERTTGARESDRDAMAVLSQRAGTLLNHFVGGGQQHFRDGEAEGFGGFEVDHKLEFGRLLHR